MTVLDTYREVWLVDFEFGARPGERPTPLCLVAHELHTSRTIRLWQDEFGPEPPYGLGADSLVVAYYSTAELGCHLVLGWLLPSNVLDLYTEFRRHTNGLVQPSSSLLGAMAYFGLDAIDITEKDEMRRLALRGGLYTATERVALLDYCESDVVALARLLPAMAPTLDLPRALLRGRYMASVAHMEHQGTPIDQQALEALQGHWDAIKLGLVERLDHADIFEGMTFKMSRFAAFLTEQGIPWPLTDTGRLELKDDTLKDMARVYPVITPIRDLRHCLGQLRLTDLAVGADDRNRCLLSPFRSRTGRNQPSNSKFIFGMASWLRSLIKPEPGMALAYIDWSQQEFGIAAALSGDDAMKAACETGDPYIGFAIQAGAAPKGATDKTHARAREQYKQCALAVLYGMGPASLAIRVEQSPAHARELLDIHRRTFPSYWRWSDAAVDVGMLTGHLGTTFGWRVQVGAIVNPRSMRNFPVQANGAEMLRLACIIATERGVGICAPVHDAVLVEAPIDRIDHTVAVMQQAMAESSGVVLGGFELRTDVDVVRYPERYSDKRGHQMWATVWDILAEQGVGPGVTKRGHQRPPVQSFVSSIGSTP